MIISQPSYYEVLIQEAAERADMTRSPADAREIEKTYEKIHLFIFFTFAMADICTAIALQEKNCRPSDYQLQLYLEPTCIKISQLSFFLIGALGLVWAGIKKQMHRNDSLKLSNELILYLPLQILPITLSFAKL
jgi:hypothetical protein